MALGWFWLSLGVALMLMEIAAPGFVIFFFGLAAATVGVIKFALPGSFTLVWQVASFSALSIIYIALLRRFLKSVFLGDKNGAAAVPGVAGEYVGRTGTVTAAIEPPLAGRVMIGDAEWNAEADTPLAAGMTVRVVSERNLTLKVAPVA